MLIIIDNGLWRSHIDCNSVKSRRIRGARGFNRSLAVNEMIGKTGLICEGQNFTLLTLLTTGLKIENLKT